MMKGNTLETPWEHGHLRVFVTASCMAACFPYAGTGRYRIVLIPKQAPPECTEISLEEVTQEAMELMPEGLKFSDPKWLSRFRVHHRMVDAYRSGNVFLAGDSAPSTVPWADRG